MEDVVARGAEVVVSVQSEESAPSEAQSAFSVVVSHDGGLTWPVRHDSVVEDSPFAGNSLLALGAGVLFTQENPDEVQGGGGVLRSMDEGASWKSVAVPGGGLQHVAAAADGHTVFGSSEHAMWRSTDNGVSWQRETGLPQAGSVNDIDAVDATHVVAVGGYRCEACDASVNRVVLASNDDGVDWHVIDDESRQRISWSAGFDALADVDLTDPLHGYAVSGGCVSMGENGPCGGGVYRTSDGGHSWVLLANPAVGGGVGAQQVLALPHGGAVTDEPAVVSSSGRVTPVLTAAADPTAVTAVAGSLYESGASGSFASALANGGWGRVADQAFEKLTDTLAPDGSEGSEGEAHAVDTAGWFTAVQSRPDRAPRRDYLAAKSGATCGNYGNLQSLLASSADGVHWHPVPAPAADRNGEVAMTGDAFVTLGCAGLAVSRDRGATWSPEPAPLAGCYQLEGDSTELWLLCRNGVAVSRDDGGHWLTHANPGFFTIGGFDGDVTLSVSDGTAVAAEEGESYWRSTDDGASWHQVWPELPVAR